MVTLGTPFKTADGHAELAARYNNLSQRHRTLLLLIDGRRSLDDVLALGRRAGVPASLIDDLVALGLVEVPMAGSRAPRDTVAMAPPVRPEALAAWQPAAAPAAPPVVTQADPGDLTEIVDDEPSDPHEVPTEMVPFEEEPAGAPVELDIDLGLDPEALATRTVSEPPGAWRASGDGVSTSGGELSEAPVMPPPALVSAGAATAPSRHEARMARARGLLMQALRDNGAPPQSMTMLRVRRARSVEDMLAVTVELAERLGRQGDLFDGMALVHQAQRLLKPLRETSKSHGN